MLTRFLGQHLRHRPASLGLKLEMGGWVDLRQFIEAAWRCGMSIGHSELKELIQSDPQHAFSLDRSGTRIRANWGHTVAFPPEPRPATPPARLYTTVGNVELARVSAEGLRRPRGLNLHITARPADPPDSVRGFGSISLLVDAAAMHTEGFLFRSMGEGDWVIDEVPPRFIRRADGASLSEAISDLPEHLRNLHPRPPIAFGRPASYEEWKARR
jgi:putative RNA 2'-phosphotransferase